MAMELINPNTTVSEPELINVAPVNYTAPLPEDIALNRANKFSLGLPNSTLAADSILNMLRNNQEEDLRKQAASELDMQRSTEQQKLLSEYVVKHGPMSLPQALMFKDMIARKQSDPDSVLEKNYSEQFMAGLVKQAQANPGGDLDEAFKKMLNANEKVATVTGLKMRQELVQTALENAEAARQAQSYLGWAADIGKGFTAVYAEAKYRGLVKDVGYWDGLLSTNLDKQWTSLYTGPVEDLIAHLNGPVKKMIADNPTLAVAYLNAAKGQSYNEQVILNYLPVFDVLAVGDLIKAGMSVGKAIQMNRVANRALESMVKPGEKIATAGAAKEAAGDIVGGAVEDFATEINRTLSPKRDVPLGNITAEGLTTGLRDVKKALQPHLDSLEDMGAPAGLTLRQEIVNRLRESMNTTFTNFIDVVLNSMKVEQLPAVLASKRVASMLAKAMEDSYRGLNNAIFNTDILKDAFSGQLFARHYIVQPGGKAFASEKTARDFVSKTQLGDVQIVPYRPEGPFQPKVVKIKGATPALSEADAVKIFEEEEVYRLTKHVRGEKTVFDPSFTPSKEAVDTSITHVEQQGAGFYIVKDKPIPVTADYTRDLMLLTKETKTPDKALAAFSSWFGKTRTPEETLALENIINRKIAAFGASQFYRIFKESAKEIKALKGWPLPFTERKAKWNQWEDVMSWLRDEPNPANGKKGLTEAFSTPGELQEKYMQRLNRLPDEQEVAASFAFRNQEILREQLKIFSQYKEYLREGASHWTIKGLQDALDTKFSKSVPIKEVSFNGTGLPEIPKGRKDVILIMDSGVEDSNMTSIGNHRLVKGLDLATSKAGKDLDEKLLSGQVKAVRLSDPDAFPLNSMYNTELTGEIRITHIVGQPLTDQPLSWSHIKLSKPSNLDYDHYVIQPRVVKNAISGLGEYLGDRTIAAFNIKSMGVQVAKELDKIRVALKSGDEAGAEALYRNSRLPMDYQEVRGWFLPDRSMEGTIQTPRLNLEEPIHVVPHGERSITASKELAEKYADEGRGFVDRTRETYGKLSASDPYDAFTLRNAGTKERPDWSVTPVQYVDPMTSIKRSLVRTINDVQLKDYQATSVEHWLQEAKGLLKPLSADLASAPLYHFHNAEFLSGLTGQEAIRARNLETARMQIKQFIGVKDANTTFVHSVAQTLSDSIYDRLGENRMLLATADKLPLLRDPFRAMRSLAFHAKVGLFAPAQLAVQLATFASIMGIAGPEKAASGTGATLLHVWSKINRNPEILEAMDKHASKYLGFKPGEFKEAHAMLTRSGFEHVGGEHVFQESTTFNDLIGGPFGTFLNAGTFLFRNGERASRTGAFYTAYREARALNPAGKFGESEARSILQRADTLAGNMTVASNSIWQRGVWSIPSQFVTYTVRQAELMLGTRLTPIEKARLFATYATLYGVPATFGSFTMGVMGDYIMKDAIANGYVSGSEKNNFFNTLITEGLPATIAHLVSGNMYNPGARYAGGAGPITDLLRGDKPILDIIMGAGGSTVYNTVRNMDGLWTALSDAVKGEGKFALKPEDFTDILREFSGAEAGVKLWNALNTGKWMSQKEMVLGDASPLNAMFMTMTGMNFQGSTEMGWINANKDEAKKQEADTMKKFILEWQRGARAFADNNPEQGHDYWNRAFHRLRATGYPQEDWSKVIAIASQGEENVLTRARMDYYTKHVAEDRKPQAFEALQKYMQTQVKK